MKYRDSEGNLKELRVKAQDNVPVGTIVDYDGDTVPDGYVEVEDNYGIQTVNYENESVIKFPDGTMIIRGTKTFNTTLHATMQHGGYRTLGNTYSFPESFIDIPNVTVTSTSDTINSGFVITGVINNVFSGIFTSVSSSNTAQEHKLNYIAIGRWK